MRSEELTQSTGSSVAQPSRSWKPALPWGGKGASHPARPCPVEAGPQTGDPPPPLPLVTRAEGPLKTLHSALSSGASCRARPQPGPWRLRRLGGLGTPVCRVLSSPAGVKARVPAWPRPRALQTPACRRPRPPRCPSPATGCAPGPAPGTRPPGFPLPCGRFSLVRRGLDRACMTNTQRCPLWGPCFIARLPIIRGHPAPRVIARLGHSWPSPGAPSLQDSGSRVSFPPHSQRRE